MEFEVTRDSRNELLSRREVDFSLRFDGATPSRKTGCRETCRIAERKRETAGARLAEDHVWEDRFGRARVYDTEEQKKKTERAFLMTWGVPKPKGRKVPDGGKEGQERSPLSVILLQCRGRKGDAGKEAYCPRCGPGVIMAEHKDRTVCGKCGYTEFRK